MSLNCKELEKVLEELELEGSRIQSSRQVSFHALVLGLYSRQGPWSLYIETASQDARIHSLKHDNYGKMDKLQRFAQFLRSNIDGSRIVKVLQKPDDRMLVMILDNHDRQMRLYIRLYSGPGANIIVTQDDDVILDLLLRRPKRGEITGQRLSDGLETWTERPSRSFEIRTYDQGQSFNDYLESYYGEQRHDTFLSDLLARIAEQRDKELAELKASLASAEKRQESSKDWQRCKTYGDLLSSNIHLMKKGMLFVDVTDYDGSIVSISLRPDLSPSQNIQAYYERYNRDKGAYEDATAHAQELERTIERRTMAYEKALEGQDIASLKALCQGPRTSAVQETDSGVICASQGFTILCGRNATENLKLLKKAKGNDHWFHSRDWPGGYVFVKACRDKTLPLSIAMQAAMLALWFSKGRASGRGSVYWTQAKYLKRVKSDSPALVIPTHEKNLDVKIDPETVRTLLGEQRLN